MATVVTDCRQDLLEQHRPLRERYRLVRARSLQIAEPLTPEDMMVQSCPEASPVKWHLAHTAWFFESFVLREFAPGYKVFHADFGWLFNSYYQSFAEFPEKRLRASFSRPGVAEILRYRQHVDAALDGMLESAAADSTSLDEALRRIELGLHHEEQHQELMLTDVKHALYTNPLQPAYLTRQASDEIEEAQPLEYFSYDGGLVEIGRDEEDGFSFDNERPRHRVWLEPFQLASRLVTCGEFAEFIADGGYSRPEFWLSAGWDAVKALGWVAPLYWRTVSGDWTVGSLRGRRPLADLGAAPVAHVSYFEADAYARWAGMRLATEAEWETAARSLPMRGNLFESGRLEPVAAGGPVNGSVDGAVDGPGQMFGDCWEWTGSAYLGYPAFVPLNGALGEYNGKFMSGQMVLRGGSCVTPAGHIRASYRNFFPPETRWQFSGIRLASS